MISSPIIFHYYLKNSTANPSILGASFIWHLIQCLYDLFRFYLIFQSCCWCLFKKWPSFIILKSKDGNSSVLVPLRLERNSQIPIVFGFNQSVFHHVPYKWMRDLFLAYLDFTIMIL